MSYNISLNIIALFTVILYVILYCIDVKNVKEINKEYKLINNRLSDIEGKLESRG